MRGTTEAINLVAQSYGRPRLRPGRRDPDLVARTPREHRALAAAVPADRRDAQGGADHAHRRSRFRGVRGPALRPHAARGMTHVSNALGTIVPVERFIAAARQRGVPVLLDGAQAVPHLAVDVQALDCDFYCFSGHKMCGPTGIGVLYGREALLREMPPWQGGGDMILAVTFEKTIYNDLPWKFEAGTPRHRRRDRPRRRGRLPAARSAWSALRPPSTTCSSMRTSGSQRYRGCASSARRRTRRRWFRSRSTASTRTTWARSSTTKASRSAPVIIARCRSWISSRCRRRRAPRSLSTTRTSEVDRLVDALGTAREMFG